MMRAHKRNFTTTLTNVNGTTIYARHEESSVPSTAATVVLVHGLSVSSGYMLPTAVRLAPYYHVHLPDLPGFGKSAKPSHILNVSELADALASWMQAMGLPPAVLLGNSLGCQIIANFALKYPERITHAVLVGPTMDPRVHTIRRAALRLVLDMPREPLTFFPVLVREYLAAGPRRTIRTLRYAFADRMEEHLPGVQVPTLVVRGARDPIVRQAWTEQVHRLLPESQLVVVQGAAHAVNFNSPAKLVSAVQSFLVESEHRTLQRKLTL
jgi:pimeloyl-ACP methyl ester carboxylesterase